MANIILSCIKWFLSVLKSALAVFLVLIALVSLLSLSFGNRLSAQQGSGESSDSAIELREALEQARQGQPISCRGELHLLKSLFILRCDTEPIFVSENQFRAISPGQILSSSSPDGLLGQWGLVEFRLIVA